MHLDDPVEAASHQGTTITKMYMGGIGAAHETGDQPQHPKAAACTIYGIFKREIMPVSVWKMWFCKHVETGLGETRCGMTSAVWLKSECFDHQFVWLLPERSNPIDSSEILKVN